MTLYKILINDRSYNSWSVCNAHTLEQITLDNFNPIEHNLFNNDIFTFNKNKVEIITSKIRVNENIPAVLILSDNKTYGRDKKNVGEIICQKGKLLYKCIPDDNSLPICLVPYEIKKMGFSKVFTNMYITVRYKHWNEKHPQFIVSQIIGPVDVLNNFYEYQLYCKNLNISIQKFSKEVNKVIKTKSHDHDTIISEIHKKYPQIEDRTSYKIFTIDPSTSLDFDDGFSINKVSDNKTLLSIYIANVALWLEFLNLWDYLTERVSTIYLPENKKPMLPSILSDCLCSLQQGVRRVAFVIDIVLDNNTNIVSLNYTNALVKVFKNFTYEENTLISNMEYQFLLNTTKKMSEKYKLVNNVVDSHDVVSYLMILMNHLCAKELLKRNVGIFRTTLVKNSIHTPIILPNELNEYIRFSIGGIGICASYVNIENIDTNDGVRHELLELDAYIHITSPIRRMVDLLNIIKFQQINSLMDFSPAALNLYSKWSNKIENINKTTKVIRKIQNDCLLLEMCVNNPDTLYKIYDGYCFNKTIKDNGLNMYTVFLPELKLTLNFVVNIELCDYEKKQFKLYLFNNEEKLNKKIKLALV